MISIPLINRDPLRIRSHGVDYVGTQQYYLIIVTLNRAKNVASLLLVCFISNLLPILLFLDLNEYMTPEKLAVI